MPTLKDIIRDIIKDVLGKDTINTMEEFEKVLKELKEKYPENIFDEKWNADETNDDLNPNRFDDFSNDVDNAENSIWDVLKEHISPEIQEKCKERFKQWFEDFIDRNRKESF